MIRVDATMHYGVGVSYCLGIYNADAFNKGQHFRWIMPIGKETFGAFVIVSFKNYHAPFIPSSTILKIGMCPIQNIIAFVLGEDLYFVVGS